MFGFSFFFLTVICLSLLMGWRDSYHVITGVATLCSLVPVYWYARRRASKQQASADRPGWLACAILGSAKGFAFWAVLVGMFSGLNYFGLYDGYLDYNREQYEQKLAVIVEAGALEEAIQVVRRRLEEPHSEEWHESLIEQLYGLLVKIGKCSDVAAQIKSFGEAVCLARDYDFVDDEPASTLLKRAIEDRAVADGLESLQSHGNWQEAVNVIRSEMNKRPREEWPFPFATWLRDALTGWGKGCKTPDEQVARYSEALQVSRMHDLDSQTIESLLAIAKERIEERDQVLERIRQLEEDEKWSSLAAFLDDKINGNDEAWILDLAVALYRAQYLAGDQSNDLEDRSSPQSSVVLLRLI